MTVYLIERPLHTTCRQQFESTPEPFLRAIA